MRRSPWLSLVVCALVAAGCQRAGPAEPTSASGSAGGGDIIEATPLTTDAPVPAAPPPGPQTPASENTEPQPAPPQPPAEAASGSDPEPSRTTIPEAWDVKTGDMQNCREAIGTPAAARLVERCIRVSPATHPPCNTANPCALIQGEIDRSCAMYGPGETRPKECQS